MKLNWSLFYSQLFFALLVFVSGQVPTPVYQYRKVLDDDGAYELFWNINETDIQFEVNVRTLGYVGFGISPSGRMSPADMVIGWVQDQDVFFGDYYTVGEDSQTPMYDDSQDWFLRARPGLQYAKEENGYTRMAFERKLDTCDGNDTIITGDTMRVIWSYHGTDPNISSSMFPYHGPDTRGSKYILFKGQNQEPEAFPPQASYRLPLQIYNYTIPSRLSTRQCLVYNMTESILKNSHLIMFEPVIQPGNEPYVYRMILTRCNLKERALINNRFDCTDGGPRDLKECREVVATWSMGAEAFYFPGDTGLSLNGPDDPVIYILDIHYTNADGTSGVVDNSGLRLIYTTSPREKEAAFLTIGARLSSDTYQLVPPGEERFTTSTFCSQRCVNWGFDNSTEPMQAIGVIFQGNDIAREMKLSHFRGSVELPWLSVDRKYDSFYQAPRIFDNPVEIKNTDSISLECTYDSSSRGLLTIGGWSQIDELCRATLIYYPRLVIDQCVSWSTFDQLVTETGEKVPGNMTMAHFQNIREWNIDSTRKFKTAFEDSTHKARCSSPKRNPDVAEDTFSKPDSNSLLLYKDPSVSPCSAV